jgi:tRNA nucleotidyltransferase (CCA-adding enzyme)
LRFLKASGWLKFFPEIAHIDACMQDTHKHPEGSVFEHACQALDVFAGMRIGDWQEDLIVGFATLCHDFGKPHAVSRDEFGIHHYDHDRAGVGPTESFLESIGAPNYLIAAVTPLVRWHMEPRFVYDENRSDRGVLLLANRVGRIDRLLRLCHADLLGRTDLMKNYTEKMETWIGDRAKKLGVLSNRPLPIVQGRDLLALGMAPSKNFTEILHRCFLAQLNCEFSDHDSAVEFLRRMVQSNGYP